MRVSKVVTLLVLVLSLNACVSRKKYNDQVIQNQKDSADYTLKIKEYESQLALLKAKNAELDSLLNKEKKNSSKLSKVLYKSDKVSEKKETKVSEEEEIKSKVVYVYSFCKYVSWPAGFKPDEFIISVAGSERMLSELTDYTRLKTYGGKKIIVRKFNPADKSVFHILYVTDDESRNFSSYKNKLKDRPTLLVTDKSNLYKAGAHVSFIESDGKIKYILNKSAAEKSGLKVSKDLVKYSMETY